MQFTVWRGAIHLAMDAGGTFEEREKKAESYIRLHTVINRVDFVSWWMWFNGSPTKVTVSFSQGCILLPSYSYNIHQDTKSTWLIAVCNVPFRWVARCLRILSWLPKCIHNLIWSMPNHVFYNIDKTHNNENKPYFAQ